MQSKPAMRGLKGKAAIVTGAAQGIGRAIADRLSEEGVNVLWADIDEQKNQESQEASGGGISMKVGYPCCLLSFTDFQRSPLPDRHDRPARLQACTVAPQTL